VEPALLFHEVVQSVAVAIALGIAITAYLRPRRHDHGLNGLGPSRPEEPLAHPDAIEIVPAVEPAVAAELRSRDRALVAEPPARRGPIASPRKPPAKSVPVCLCGEPGKACPIHGLR